jgi:hypothetical protein
MGVVTEKEEIARETSPVTMRSAEQWVDFNEQLIANTLAQKRPFASNLTKLSRLSPFEQKLTSA